MKNYIDDFDIDFECPSCNKKIQIKASDIGSVIKCQHCNQSIELKDDNFTSGINEVNKALNDFNKNLNNLFK